MILNSPYISGSLTVTGNITAQGGISISGSIASASYASTASYWSGSIVNALSASYAASSTTAANAILLNNTASAQFATTGSNTFTGNQYVSATTVPNGFSGTTAAVYTDGGMQVTKDVYLSSSLYIKGNLTVYGTESIAYITSSQLNIATNLITVNTSTPAVRFGGLAVQDSGSVNGLTGSLLWDSQNNTWIYSNPSGSGNYDSAMVLMGPQNSSGLGNEVGITFNSIPKGAGSHHMTSSAIFDVSGSIAIGNSLSSNHTITGNLSITGSENITGSSSTTAGYFTNSDSEAVGSRGFYKFKGTNGNASARWWAIKNDVNVLGDFMIMQSAANSDASYASKLYISSSGNIGMGTTTPNAPLHIVGGNETIRIDTTSTSFDSSIRFYNNNSATYWGGIQTGPGAISGGGMNIYTNGAYPIVFYISGSEKMRILTGGNVGIGTTSPTSISSGYTSLTTNGVSGSGLVMQLNGTAQGYIYVESGDMVINNTSGYTAFYNAGSERMRITSGGNVGIGTTNPTSRPLTIYNSASTGGISFRGASTGDAGNILLEGYDNDDNEYSNLQFVANSGNGYFVFNSATGTNPNSWTSNARMVIGTNGKVGIGTTSPGYTLDVNGNAQFSVSTYQKIQTYYSSPYTSGFKFSDLYGSITYDAGGDTMNINAYKTITFSKTSGGQAETMRITEFGKLLIGRTSELTATTIKVEAYQPANQHVYWGYVDNGSGNAVLYARIDSTVNVFTYFQYTTSIVGSIGYNGSNTTYNTTSDYRIKSDFENFNGLDIVTNLNPCKFKINNSEKKIAGFVAHELQPYIPQAVTGEKDAVDENGDPIYQQVDVSQIVPFLTKAIQEQQTLIQSLTDRITALENK